MKKITNHLKLLGYFFRLGFFTFGGPFAIIAQIQRDLVDRRKLISQDNFKKSLALIKSFPGPTGTQVMMFSAHQVGGFWFSLAASVLFILPSYLMMVILAAYYDQYHANQEILIFLEGMQAGAFVLIMMALYNLTKPNLSSIRFWTIFYVALILIGLLKFSEPLVIIGAGLAAMFWSFRPEKKTLLKSYVPWDLFLISIKAGTLAFGTGYAIIPLLQHDYVEIHNWITKAQFMDALAFGQLTPGPVSISVTFVGYRVAGWAGATAATVGIFLPGFINMTTWFPRAFEWFEKQSWVKPFVMGATASIAAGIIVTFLSMSVSTSILRLIIPSLLVWLSVSRNLPSWAVVILSGSGWWIFSHLLNP